MYYPLIISLILIIIVLIYVYIDLYNKQKKMNELMTYYINIFKMERNMKTIMCKSNNDCSDGQVCQMDLDRVKRCFNKTNMIKRVCNKLIISIIYYYNNNNNNNNNEKMNRKKMNTIDLDRIHDILKYGY